MRNKKLIIGISAVVLCLVLLLSVFLGVEHYKKKLIESGYGDAINSANQYAKRVSMLQLIATPHKYNGELVRVIGVGNLEFEGDCIALSKDDLKFGTYNQIWIELSNRATPYKQAKEYNGEYVIIEGIFNKDNKGHMGMFCGAIENVSRYEPWRANQTGCVIIKQALDKTYSYEIYDYAGSLLTSKNNLSHSPERLYPDTDTAGVSVQAGTGLSTKWTVFADLKNGILSPTFYYVLAAQNSRVIFAEYKDGKHYITVCDMFDKTKYYKSYELKDVSDIAADFVADCKIKDGSAVVTYFAGENYDETEITINFP